MPDVSNELEAICTLGERIRAALDAGTLDQLSELIRQRATAIEHLRAPGRPAGALPEERRMADELVAQHRALTGALAERQQDVEAALARLERLDEAHQSYAAAPPRPEGVLNRNLCG